MRNTGSETISYARAIRSFARGMFDSAAAFHDQGSTKLVWNYNSIPDCAKQEVEEAIHDMFVQNIHLFREALVTARINDVSTRYSHAHLGWAYNNGTINRDLLKWRNGYIASNYRIYTETGPIVPNTFMDFGDQLIWKFLSDISERADVSMRVSSPLGNLSITQQIELITYEPNSTWRVRTKTIIIDILELSPNII